MGLFAELEHFRAGNDLSEVVVMLYHDILERYCLAFSIFQAARFPFAVSFCLALPAHKSNFN